MQKVERLRVSYVHETRLNWWDSNLDIFKAENEMEKRFLAYSSGMCE